MAKYNATTGEIDFALALDALKRGQRIRRRDWGHAYIKLENGGFYMWMPSRDKDVAWVPTWKELLATDWSEVIGVI